MSTLLFKRKQISLTLCYIYLFIYLSQRCNKYVKFSLPILLLGALLSIETRFHMLASVQIEYVRIYIISSFNVDTIRCNISLNIYIAIRRDISSCVYGIGREMHSLLLSTQSDDGILLGQM